LADYYQGLALYFIFDKDPENDVLEAEKNAVQDMVDKARARNEARAAADKDISSSDSSDEETNECEK
jgi:hypothetical protein